MLEAEDDLEVFAALLGAAEGWLRERGMRRVRGPFNLSINEECGLLVEGFEHPPSMLMSHARPYRSEEHTSELQSLMRISYAVFCLKKKTNKKHHNKDNTRHSKTKAHEITQIQRGYQ